SPNGWKGHSGLIGAYLGNQLRMKGVTVEIGSLHAAFSSETKMQEVANAAQSADQIVLTVPLYEDQLPAPVIHALAGIAGLLRNSPGTKLPRLAVLVNSGFPEAVHNDVALAIYRQFAVTNGWEWAGGLEIPGGGMLDGKSLESLGPRSRRIQQALDLTAVALASGAPVPARAFEKARRPSIPAGLYRFMANCGFRWHARGTSLKAQPLNVETASHVQ
ncbi:MAG TPA: hypothetical protein VMT62_05165, partial [Syntrophorhabdaceae bacterium]|nr:hypothetical protein [Syntrophorhabdaceae bacterium]